MGVKDRDIGRRAKLMATTSMVTVNMKVLTDDGDHQTFSSGNQLWVEEPDFLEVWLDGLVSGGSVNPGASNDIVSTEAGSVYIGGELVEFAADASTAISRPTNPGDVRVTSIVVDSSGNVSAVNGTAGTSSTTRGAAGGPPLLTAGTVEICQVTTTSSSAAIILASEINMDAASRYDTPGMTIDFVRGKVVLDQALPVIYSSSGVRKVYAQYKYAVISEVGDLYGFDMQVTGGRVDRTAFNEDWQTKADQAKTWSASAEGYYVNSFWFNQAVDIDKVVFIKFFHDRRRTRYHLLRAYTDWAMSCAKDAMVTQSLTFDGEGEPVLMEA